MSEIYEYEDKWLHQRIEELEKQNTILCEALERIYSPYLTPDYSSSDLRELAGQAIIDVADDETFDRDGGELMLFNTIDLKAAYQAGYLQAMKDNATIIEALESIADPYDCTWYKSSHDADDVVDVMIAMARMAIKKVEG